MKHLQSFSLFESRSPDLTPDQESFLNQYTKGTWSVNPTIYTRGTWSVNPTTGLVDVQGRFDCSEKRLKSLLGISFGHVSGYFYCYYNQLTTLVGAPTTVDGDFNCHFNQLTTLVGAPTTVGGRFDCDKNQLTTLEGAPTTVDGGFYCDAFSLKPGEWNPVGWAKILATGDDAARRLILTLPVFDADWWLQRLAGDLKKDGQVLLQLAALWEEPGWENQRHEISQRLSSDQLRAIKVLKTKLDYVNPWQDFRF
jgi:hypothetical protein